MKKLMKAMALILVAMLMMTAFVGCSSDKEDTDHKEKAVDTTTPEYIQYKGPAYSGTFEFNGKQYDMTIVLEDEENYRRITKIDGTAMRDVTGRYEWVSEGELRLLDSSGVWCIYTHKDGVLENNGNQLKKVN